MESAKQWSLAGGSLFAAALLASGLFVSKPVHAQDESGKKFCVGCSVDGKTTPMTADGHPDFSGYWGGGNAPPPGAAPVEGRGPTTEVFQRSSDGSILYDFGTEFNSGKRCVPLDESCQQPNQPPYNATYMKKVREIAAGEFYGTSPLDPYNSCKATGVPRAGFPQMIMQTPDHVVFFYDASPYSTFRIIYLNGRPHPDMKEYETTYFGDSIGKWEGNTLVIDTIGFNDDTWLNGPGVGGFNQFTSVHSEKEHAVERLTRDGDVVTYDVTVDDSDALTKPWVLATRRIRHSGAGMEVPGVDALTENICLPTGHMVKPTSEDKDIKGKCAYRCQDTDSK